MNIFKQKHGTIKEELKIFGTQIRYNSVDPKVKYTASFWERKYIGELISKNEQTWSFVFTKYLYLGCDYEERKFIDLMFFQCQKIVFVSFNLHLCLRSCSTWELRILDNIAGLAIQANLLYIDLVNNTDSKDRKSKSIINHYQLTDDEWLGIEKILTYTTGRPSKNIRKTINGILFILYNGLAWRNLPKAFGSWNTVYYHYLCWKQSGLWQKIIECLDSKPLRG